MSSRKLNHLQGLRGIAILAVVLFHFFPSHFQNGYIGVDIFFLLSGYLMTMMMFRYTRIGFYNILDFLYKRLKRIAPLYYLSIFFILVALQFTAETLINSNVPPAWNAILFITNLIQPDKLIGYFEKLGTAVDVFTHTWSLSLEVQYYLFFPFIFIIYRHLSEEKGQLFLIISSILSFLFYILADEFTSFNSMFARIWQFNAGTMAFINSNSRKNKHQSSEQEKLLENEDTKEKVLDFSGTVNMGLIILAVLLCSQKAIDSTFSRIASILLTMTVVQYGQGNLFLENKFLVFIGEISYGWYLFHWPIAAYCKLQQFSFEVFLGALCASFLISIFIHFIFERRYLRWENFVIYAIVFILLAANMMILLQIKVPTASEKDFELKEQNNSKKEPITLENKFMWPSDYIEDVSYENKTKEEIIKLNKGYSANDLAQLYSFCGESVPIKFKHSFRCLYNDHVNKKSKERLLVIGNSWAGNAMPAIKAECQDKFSHLELIWTGTCEPLITKGVFGKVDCSFDEQMFVGTVKEVQPDVLFIISRGFNSFVISGGSSNPFNDPLFKTAARRLTEIQKYVKRRIFILDAFPVIDNKLEYALNGHLSSGKKINFESYFKINEPYAIAKMRFSRLAAECPKCKLFDYMPQFYFNRTFSLYDPKSFISFMSTTGHLTPPGVERVRPIYKHLCNLK